MPRAPQPDADLPPAAGRPSPLSGVGPDPQLLADAAETFSMLASPTRLHLLWLLSQGGRDVGSLAEAVGGSVATVSQHLAKLRLADLVSARRQGKRQVYEVDDPHVVTLLQQALDHQADLRALPAGPLPRDHANLGDHANSVTSAGGGKTTNSA